jgi:hypothetical protein
MIKTYKNAWLVGLYTSDIETRIERLGYKLTRLFPDLTFIGKVEESPSLIVFSEDQFSDPNAMLQARNYYPDAVMISLPIEMLFAMKEHPGSMKPKNQHSIIRLITLIQHMENRWNN